MSPQIPSKKSLGQNFLKDQHYLSRIVEAAGIAAGDQVLEIGPGLGHLTRLLAAKARKVLALELDDRLIPVLKQEFCGQPNIEILHADALDYPYAALPETWKVVANLPYYISTPVVQRLLTARSKFSTLTLMLQKEVAERIAAQPGGKEYGYLSVLVQMHSLPRIHFLVPPEAFTPHPKVDSAVITLEIFSKEIEVRDEQFLIRVVKAAFSHRRKTLRNALKQLDVPAEKLDTVFAETGLDLGRRAETLSVQEFVRLADVLLG